jgi:hypothetical protein
MMLILQPVADIFEVIAMETVCYFRYHTPFFLFVLLRFGSGRNRPMA